jgi:hypothetical protein
LKLSTQLSPGPARVPWVLAGLPTGDQVQLFVVDYAHVEVSMQSARYYAMGSPQPQYAPAGHAEMKTWGPVGRQLMAPTFAECFGLLAQSWNPDHHGIDAQRFRVRRNFERD